MALDLSGKKPTIRANVSLGDVDLTPYMAAQTDDSKTITDQRGNRYAWSELPLNLEGLNSFDAQIEAGLNKLTFEPYELGQSTARAALENGILRLNVTEAQLYGGRGKVDFSLNAASDIPHVGLKTEMVSIKSKPFLLDAANFSKLTGDANLNLDITGQGRSQAEIMRSLSGRGEYSFTDGVIEGVDLNMIKNIGDYLKRYDSLKLADILNLTRELNIGGNTQINRLRGGFKMQNGVAKTDDFLISTPYGDIGGGGLIDVGGQKLDFALRPKVDMDKIPQLAQYKLGLVEIPVAWSGGFGGIGAPKVDLVAALKNPVQQALTRKVTGDVLKDVVGDDVGGVLGDVLGGSSGRDGEQPKKLEDVAKDKLFDAIDYWR